MRRRCISATALILAVAMLFSLSVTVFSAPAEEIEAEIDRLEQEADNLAAEKAALERDLSETEAQTRSYAEEKLKIDREIAICYREVENLSEQIQQHNLLIAERQADLDELKAQQDLLWERYRLRMRSMQEQQKVTIWTVLLSSDSFAELLRNRVMIEEIAAADQRMMDSLRQSSEDILRAKEALAAQKATLELRKDEQREVEAELAEKREAADKMLAELNADQERLKDEIRQAEALEAELHAQIAQKEKEYNESHQVPVSPIAPSDSGFLFPCSPSGFQMITSSYGGRTDPFTGDYSFHNGVDLACYLGTEVYASKSGTVTTAASYWPWGEHVVVNHGDGFSTLYAHMTHFVVSEGEYVQQGQLIGYVGSTGRSTGPHLHFTVYYNGSTVNPMSYISLP